LFAALNVAEGVVIDECIASASPPGIAEVSENPPDVDLHLIADNYATHKHRRCCVAGRLPALSDALHADEQQLDASTLVRRLNVVCVAAHSVATVRSCDAPPVATSTVGSVWDFWQR
jgi:hypothetical protein